MQSRIETAAQRLQKGKQLHYQIRLYLNDQTSHPDYRLPTPIKNIVRKYKRRALRFLEKMWDTFKDTVVEKEGCREVDLLILGETTFVMIDWKYSEDDSPTHSYQMWRYARQLEAKGMVGVCWVVSLESGSRITKFKSQALFKDKHMECFKAFIPNFEEYIQQATQLGNQRSAHPNQAQYGNMTVNQLFKKHQDQVPYAFIKNNDQALKRYYYLKMNKII